MKARNILNAAASALGAALGTLAGKEGIDHPAKKPRTIGGKFVPQDKHRLPRKEKKRLAAEARG
jgi:hypothetical protein